MEDSLRYSKSRINAYRALASPSLISLSSKDPILTAFQLSWELKRLSRIENEFKVEYEKLSVQCQEYASALLAETRTSQELEVILNYDHENPPVLLEGEKEKMNNLSRLKLGIKYKQKMVCFVKIWKKIVLWFNCSPTKSLWLIRIVNSYLSACGTMA